MNGCSFVSVVLKQDGGSLVDEHVHTLHVAFKGSQVQRRVSLHRPHIQVQQGLNQHLQSMVMAMKCLECTQTHTKRFVPWYKSLNQEKVAKCKGQRKPIRLFKGKIL